MSSGQLIIRPICARLIHDPDWFHKANPYCKISVGNKSYQTGVAKNEGMTPIWQETFTHELNGESSIQVHVFDHHHISHDKPIADGVVQLDEVFQKGSTDAWYPLIHKEKPDGQINLRIKFVPSIPK